MPTVWGTLDHIHINGVDDQWVQIKTVLSGGVAVHVRALIGHQTTIARGTQRVQPSTLREGGQVELTYCYGQAGLVAAETVYVHPDEERVIIRI
jgi:hypothetical protein